MVRAFPCHGASAAALCEETMANARAAGAAAGARELSLEALRYVLESGLHAYAAVNAASDAYAEHIEPASARASSAARELRARLAGQELHHESLRAVTPAPGLEAHHQELLAMSTDARALLGELAECLEREGLRAARRAWQGAGWALSYRWAEWVERMDAVCREHIRCFEGGTRVACSWARVDALLRGEARGLQLRVPDAATD